MLACVALRSAFADASARCASESSRVASTKPLCTCIPSVKKTPVTRPVIFAATVARRCGVTYPLALSRACGPVSGAVGRGDLYRWHLMHVCVDSAHDDERGEQDKKDNRDALSSFSRAALVGVDAQPSKVRFYSRSRHGSPARFTLVSSIFPRGRSTRLHRKVNGEGNKGRIPRANPNGLLDGMDYCISGLLLWTASSVDANRWA